MTARLSLAKLLFVLLAAVLGGGGCAASSTLNSSTSSSTAIDRWAIGHGGLIAGARQDRAERTLARLVWSSTVTPDLTIAILDTDDVGAFSWRSGEIFVTRGLIDLVDDDELAAAIAHEAGHLVADNHVPHASALNGGRHYERGGTGAPTGAGGIVRASTEGEDREMAADAAGRELLRLSTVPDDALPRLLKRLAADPATAPACRDHLRRRIARLITPAS